MPRQSAELELLKAAPHTGSVSPPDTCSFLRHDGNRSPKTRLMCNQLKNQTDVMSVSPQHKAPTLFLQVGRKAVHVMIFGVIEHDASPSPGFVSMCGPGYSNSLQRDIDLRITFGAFGRKPALFNRKVQTSLPHRLLSVFNE